MDLADDAEGRVAIFRVGESPSAAPAPAGRGHRGGLAATADGLGRLLDGTYAGVGVAVVLVVILVLGLLLSRH
jgi:hypothetical protein